MLSGKVWASIALVILILGSTSYVEIQRYVRSIANNVDADSEQRLVERADVSLESLERNFLSRNDQSTRAALKSFSQGERIDCVEISENSKSLSFPDLCRFAGSNKIISITTKSGITLKVQESASLAEELMKSIQFGLGTLLFGFLISFGLMVLFFSLSLRWISKFSLATLQSLTEGTSTPRPSSVFFNVKDMEKYSKALNLKVEEYRNVLILRGEEAAMVKVASQVSHDIKSPLGALQLIQSQIKFPSATEEQVFRSSVDRINAISGGLLAYSWKAIGLIASASEQQIYSPVLTWELLKPTLEQILREKGILDRVKINWSVNDQVELRLDLNEWLRILSNLVNNALEAAQSKAELICINVSSANDGFVNVVIEDQGKGMSVAQLERIGKFGHSIGKGGGHGIGLNHAIETISRWGSKLQITSELGVGTSVSIILPARNIAEAVPGSIFEKEISVGTPSSTGLNFKTLKDFTAYYRENFSDLENTLFKFGSDLDPNELVRVISTLGIQHQYFVNLIGSSNEKAKEFQDIGLKLNRPVKDDAPN